MSTVYMRVTRDKYALPLACADSIRELAQSCGVAKGTIESELSRARHGKKRPRYIEVEVKDGYWT